MKSKKVKRTVELTVEKREFRASAGQPVELFAWCAGCGARARMVTPEEAAAAAGVTPRTIYRWVEAGHVHFMETDAGALHICLGSLPH